MSYDPSQDPRWLPPEEEDANVIDLDAEHAAIGREMLQLESVLAITTEDGWAVLSTELTTKIADAYRALRASTDLPSLYRAKGTLDALEWVLGVPEHHRVRHQELKERLDEVERSADGRNT